MDSHEAISKETNAKLTKFYYPQNPGINFNRELTAKEVSLFARLENEIEILTLKQFLVYFALRRNERINLYKKELTKTELKPLSRVLGISLEELKKRPEVITSYVYIFKLIDKVLKGIK